MSVSAEVTPAEWDRYVDGHPSATVDHAWAWRAIFKNALGHDSVFLAARRQGRVVGVLPLVLFRSRLFGRSVVSVPFLNYGGILSDGADVSQALVDRAAQEARAFGASWVELRHAERHCPALPFRQHKVAMTKELPTTVDALWAGTDRKVRNQVRKAQKEGLTTLEGGSELIDEFYGVFAENMRDLGTPVYSRRLFRDVLAGFGPSARVYVVRDTRRALAAAVALAFRDTVLVPWASSLRRFRHLCPNMLLYWSMLERAVSEHRQVFDFGRSSPGGGTHQFKLQWGARETPLFWEYLLLSGTDVPDHGPGNPTYGTMINIWRRLPVRVTMTLGPAIVRNIP